MFSISSTVFSISNLIVFCELGYSPTVTGILISFLMNNFY
ncbi:hypothetical protein ND00_03510 [Clostridium sp. L74]|nr:hypothetical protein ND00_03510 [Clostridium sp. L74]